MVKQIEIHGQRVKLYSPDGGRTWSRSPQSIVAYGRRKKTLRLELQKRFERIDERKDLDPNNFSELKILQKTQKAKKKITMETYRISHVDTVLGRIILPVSCVPFKEG
jgi:hypothetical protein